MAKNIRTCRYSKCKHSDKKIDISTDDFVADGQKYYHKDCYESIQKESRVKSDFQYIKNQWVLHISNTVVYSQLYKVLNGFLERGVSSDYLVFCVDYIISHGMRINYPPGLNYYIDRPEIKKAYMKDKISKMKRSKSSSPVIDYEDPPENVESTQKKRPAPKGFESILRRNKQEN